MKKIIVFLIVVTAFFSINLNAKEVKYAPTDIVNIPDDNLKVAINRSLGNPPNQEISYADMESLTDFQFNKSMTSSGKLTSLEGMQYAKNMTSIYISGEYGDPLFIDGIDFSPIVNLPNIDILAIQFTDLKDISSLKGVKAKNINFGYNQIEDISVIDTFSEAEAIDFMNNKISVLPNLNVMPNLLNINFSMNQIYSIEPITDFCVNGPTMCNVGMQVSTIDLGNFTYDTLPNEYNYTFKDWDGNDIYYNIDMTNTSMGDNITTVLFAPSIDSPISGDMLNFSDLKFTWTYSGHVPVIDGIHDISINEGEDLDLLLGITAIDEEEGDLTSKIVVDDSKLDTDTPGKYEVTFTVTDSDGNITIEKETIEVKAVATPNKPVNPTTPEDSTPDKVDVIYNKGKKETKGKKLIQTGKENFFIVVLITVAISSNVVLKRKFNK